MLENGFQSPLAGVPARQPSHGWWIAASVFVAALVVGSVGGWRIAHWRQPGAVGRAYRLQLNLPEGATFIAAASNPGIASAPDSSAVVYTAAMSGKSASGSSHWMAPRGCFPVLKVASVRSSRQTANLLASSLRAA